MTERKVVMISSTAHDLPEHRDQVRLACERAGFAPHEMMEHGTAEHASPAEVSLRMVADADVYVLILAFRYGTVPPGQEMSLTEMEYNRAVELKKPLLVFVADKQHPITIDDVETGSGAEKLQKLKTRIGEAHVTAFFKSADDLRACAFEALNKLSKTLEATDVRNAAPANAAANLHRRSAIPTPPEPYVAHPYTLLQTRELIGRQAELNALTDWVANPGSPAFGTRIFSLVAIGGMGKSALAWKWFRDIAPNEMKPLAGRLWWSFYESDATVENFMIRALCYVSGESEDAARRRTWQDRETLLLKHLDETPYLIVLDGLERILIAYNRMDASSLADDAYDQKTANVVAGAVGLPPSAAQSFTGEHRLRQNTDPRAGNFLRKLAQIKSSRVLITTRLYPYALQLPTRHPWPGCSAYFLPGLSDDGALDLWRALKVTGSRTDLAPIFRKVEGHPLLVQIFAGVVANYRAAPGNFAKWKSDHPNFDLTSLLVEQSRARIIAVALEGLSPAILEVLHTIVGFRMPASYETLEALLVGEGKAQRSTTELDRVLTELEDRGLIGWDREANRYDAHPIVRGVVWQLADAEDKRAVLSALESYFEPMQTPDMEDVKSISNLAPAIERFHTLVELQRFGDAWDLFFNRLQEATLYRLAAHRERISWLEALLPNGVAASPELSGRPEASALNSLALGYTFCGQPNAAIPLFQRAVDIALRVGDARSRQIFLDNLSMAYFEIGATRLGAGAALGAIVLAREMANAFSEATALHLFGRQRAVNGDETDSFLALTRSQRIFASDENQQSEGVASAFLSERSLFLSDTNSALRWAERSRELASHLHFERDLIRAALVLGEAHLALGNFGEAEEQLSQAVSRSRAVNVVEMELPAVIALADLDMKCDRLPEARAKLDDVWEAAEQGPYRLRQADAYNVLAEIERKLGNTAAAVDAAVKAFKAAWCDGPPYAYHWGLERAKANLDALGVPHPDPPPFDESAFEPLPEVDLNLKDEYWVDPEKPDEF